MRAVGFFEFGGPEVLQVLDLPEGQPGTGQVRVRVHAATVNPTDTLLRNGSRAQALRAIQPPHVPGMDVAGVIDDAATEDSIFPLLPEIQKRMGRAVADAYDIPLRQLLPLLHWYRP